MGASAIISKKSAWRNAKSASMRNRTIIAIIVDVMVVAMNDRVRRVPEIHVASLVAIERAPLPDFVEQECQPRKVKSVESSIRVQRLE